MFRPQVVAALLVTLVVIGMIWSGASAWIAPSAESYGSHSFSGRAVGYRGLYELLQAFHVPVTRATDAPDALFQGRRRVLLLQPAIPLIEREKGYLAQMQKWIDEGGEVVVVARDLSFRGAEDAERDEDESTRASRLEDILGPDQFLKRLGVGEIRIEPSEEWTEYDDEDEDLSSVVGRSLQRSPRPETEYEPIFSGTLEALAGSVKKLKLPDSGLTWFGGDGVERAEGKVEVEGEDGGQLPLVLDFAVGKGRVLLVSEPTLLNNVGLREADNAVLAYRLAAGDGTKEVILDEYYHGALEGVGPMALLAVFPYWAVAASILLATLVWAWSHGVRFGTPVPHAPDTRRNILEYVDALARLFRRGSKTDFALRTNREGLLDELRAQLHMAHGSPEALVVRRLAQVDSERADTLTSVLREVDDVLASSAFLPGPRLLQLQGRLETCRISMNRSHTSRPSPATTASPASTAASSAK